MVLEIENAQPLVMTIAGLDPSGGAGIIADVKAFLHFECTPVAVLTSITFQNSEAVFGAIHESGDSLRAQILPLIQEKRIAALKLGMMPTTEIILEIAGFIRERQLPAPVIDPVFQSSSGYDLIEPDAIDVLRRDLMPLARLITPNIPEAEILTGVTIEDEQTMHEAAERLREMGARAVLVKGGHLIREFGIDASPIEAVDVLHAAGGETVFRGEWIEAPSVRGTGCMLSSAIAACLGQGLSLAESVRAAKNYVADAIRFVQETESDQVSP